MKAFFKNNMSVIIRMLVNQIGMMIFGFAVASATSTFDGYTFLCLGSVFSIIFYLVLLYNVSWEAGAKDKIRVDSGRIKYSPLTGLYMSMVANIPNFILAVLIIVGKVFGSLDGSFGYKWAGNMYTVANFAARIFESMYLGLIQTYSPYNPIAFLLIIFPALFVCTVGYIFGLKNLRVGKFFGIKSAADKKIAAQDETMKKYHSGDDSDIDGTVE